MGIGQLGLVDVRDAETAPSLGLGLVDVEDAEEAPSLVTVRAAATVPMNGFGLVSVMDAEDAPSLGQLTRAEGAKVAALKKRSRRLWWNPFAKMAISRQIARIEIMAKKRAAAKAVVTKAIVPEAAEAELPAITVFAPTPATASLRKKIARLEEALRTGSYSDREGGPLLVLTPALRLVAKRELAAGEAQLRRLQAEAGRTAQAAAVVAAEPKIALGPISPEAAKGLSWDEIKRKVKANAFALQGRKEGTLRSLAAETKTVAAKEKAARATGWVTGAAQLKTTRQALQNQIAKLRRAKVRPENLVRKEVEKARVKQAMARGAAGIAQYGQRRFQEGKAAAAGVFTEEMGREFLGPYRTQ